MLLLQQSNPGGNDTDIAITVRILSGSCLKEICDYFIFFSSFQPLPVRPVLWYFLSENNIYSKIFFLPEITFVSIYGKSRELKIP